MMRNLRFRYLKAENILCFGPDGIELFLSDYGNVIQVTGVNLDNPGTADDPASNGSGKSTLQDLISIGLYGKMVKNPTKNKAARIINTLADKGTVDIQWDSYRVVRTFKKSSSGSMNSKVEIWENKDHIWDDNSNVTKIHKDTQKWIDDKVGLTHHTFCNVVIFDDSNTYSFLEADTPTKRELVENLLGLDQYRLYHQNAKELLKEQKKIVELLSKEYQNAESNKDYADRQVTLLLQQEKTWESQKRKELNDLVEKAKQKESLLGKDFGALLTDWQNTQQKVADLTKSNSELEAKRVQMKEVISKAREKVNKVKQDRDSLNSEISTAKLEISRIKAEIDEHLLLIKKLELLQDGVQCPYCYGTVSKANYDNVLHREISRVDACNSSALVKQTALSEQQQNFVVKQNNLSAMESKIKEAESKVDQIEQTIHRNQKEIINLSKIPRPDVESSQRVLAAEVTEMRRQIDERKAEIEGDSPYKAILVAARNELEQKQEESLSKSKNLVEAEKEIPYFDYWVEAFGDNGIRRYVIDGIIPALNSRIAYWLQYLIDGKIEVTFDNCFEETITRNGTPAFYSSMSNGERRRINLAISQAFAYVMMLNSGSCPSLVFLDEITGGSIDRAGVVGVYNMIFELAKERQVFVTTHNEVLLSMLGGCEKITLKKHNDITVLAS